MKLKLRKTWYSRHYFCAIMKMISKNKHRCFWLGCRFIGPFASLDWAKMYCNQHFNTTLLYDSNLISASKFLCLSLLYHISFHRTISSLCSQIQNQQKLKEYLRVEEAKKFGSHCWSRMVILIQYIIWCSLFRILPVDWVRTKKSDSYDWSKWKEYSHWPSCSLSK